MLETLKEIINDHWAYRKQILGLAITDITKQTRGAAFGWLWLFVKPAIYICVFWFALEVGLKAGRTTGGDLPFLLWLAAGLFPWFFMQSMIMSGSNAYKKYPYLVNKLTFPMSVINTFVTLSFLIVNVMLMCILVAYCLITGMGASIYLLQLPFIYVVMGIFWGLFSLMMSPLCAISRDLSNFMNVISTPFFWLSGIIFNLDGLDIPVLQTVLAFNPVSSFATASRASIYYQYWIWDRPEILIPFAIVFAITAVGAFLSYHFLRKEVADVL